MGIPIFFVLFLVFIAIYNYNSNQISNQIQKKREAFIKREEQTLFVRKTNLDNLNYITPNLKYLPFHDNLNLDYEKEKELFDIEKEIKILLDSPMLNLSNMDNTDLKLKYGIGNLDTLINYESNYINFLKLLVDWSEILIDLSFERDAIIILEEGIRLNSDITKNYLLLAELYSNHNEKEKIHQLYINAKEISLPFKNKILGKLRKYF